MSKKAIIHCCVLGALILYTIFAWNSLQWEKAQAKEDAKEALESSGFRNKDVITHRFESADLKSIRPSLSNDFRELLDEDLLVLDAEIHSSLNARPTP